MAALPMRAAKAPKLTVVDLFAGAGGLSEGFRLAGYSVLGGLDIDPDAVATYRRNFGAAEAVCGNIRHPSIRERVSALAHDADVIAGAPPFSGRSQSLLVEHLL